MNNNYITIYKTEEELKKVVLNKLWESYTLENFILENVKKKKAIDKFFYGDIRVCLFPVEYYVSAILYLVGKEKVVSWVNESSFEDKKSILSTVDFLQAYLDDPMVTEEEIKEDFGLTLEEYLTVVDFGLKIKLALKD